MGNYYYKNTEPGLWTVGTDDANGKWQSESDHNDREDAAKRVRFLNGGIDLSGLLTREDFYKYLDLWSRQNKIFGELLTEILKSKQTSK